MGQKALSAPTRDFNEIDSLIGRMSKDGVKTAGKAFVGASPVRTAPVRKTASTLTPEVVSSYKQSQANKKSSILGFGEVIKNEVVKSAKNAYGTVTYAIPRGFTQPIKQLAFSATHGGKDEDSFYTAEYNKIADTKKSIEKQLNDNLASGKISLSDYKKANEEVSAQYGAQLTEAEKKVKETRASMYGTRDLQTGEQKDSTSAQDIFNTIDGGLTVISIASGGTAWGKGMSFVGSGPLKVIENSALKSLTKIAGVETSERIATTIAKTGAGKLANSIDDIIGKTIQNVPGLREYSERQIAKLGGDITAKQFVKNAVAAVVIQSPLRQMNIDSARTVVDSVMNDKFLDTPEGQTWLSSGAGQSILLAGMMLEGGPIGFVTKVLKKSGAALKVATFGDDAVRIFDQLAPKAGMTITDDAVKAVMTQAATGKSGTKLDHFFRVLSGDADDAMLGYKWLAEHPDKIPQFKSIYATLLRTNLSDSVWQAAGAGIIKDLIARGGKVNIDDAMTHLFKWQKAGELGDEITKMLQASGKLKPGQRAVVVSFTRGAQDKARKDITAVLKEVSKGYDELDVPQAGRTNSLPPLKGVAEEDIVLHRGVNSTNIAKSSSDRPVYYADTPEYAGTYGDVTSKSVTGRVLTADGIHAYDNISGDLRTAVAKYLPADEWKKLTGSEQTEIQSWLNHTLEGERLSKQFNKPMPEVVKKAFEDLGIDYIRIPGDQFKGTVGKIGHQTEIIEIPKPSVSPHRLGADKATILKSQKDAAIAYIHEQQKAGVAWAQHDGLVEDMITSIRKSPRAFAKKGTNTSSIIEAIKAKETAAMVQGIPTKVQKELQSLGYYLGLPKNVGNPFVATAEAATTKIESILVGKPHGGKANVLGLNKSANIDDLSAVLGDDVARVQGANPAFGQVGALLNKLGIGLGDGHKTAYELITTNIANHIDDAKLGVNGVESLRKLQDYAENSRTITDLRQMTKNEIEKALGVSKSSAGKIQSSLVQGYLDVPLHIRGLGDKAVDWANKINPIQAIYSRVQGALRYTYNPFFRVQESVETKLLGIALTDGKSTWLSTLGKLNPKSSEHLDDIVSKMDNGGLLEATQYGEAATTGVVGRVSAKLTRGQKRDLASVIDTIADKHGMTVDDLLATKTDEVLDIIRPIVQYPSRGAINSNFARTLNIAAFPSRYNLKVTGLALDVLSKQRPAVQGAVINGLFNFSSWLNSDAGLAWRQDYANEIAAFKWLTPVGNLEWTMKRLQGENNSWSEIGQLGGLPFGLWSQILQSQGIIDLQSPYVDPKTGEIYSKRVPASLKGRMAMAIMDMLGSTFTYPGRTLQLPGKGQILRDVAYKATGASGSDFRYEPESPDDLSPDKRKAQEFWSERAKSKGMEQKTVTPTAPKPTIAQRESTAPVLGKYTKTDLRNAKAKSKSLKTGGKKKKQPVPFQTVVGM